MKVYLSRKFRLNTLALILAIDVLLGMIACMSIQMEMHIDARMISSMTKHQYSTSTQ